MTFVKAITKHFFVYWYYWYYFISLYPRFSIRYLIRQEIDLQYTVLI